MKIKKIVGMIAIVMSLALSIVAITGVLNIAKDRDKNDDKNDKSEETTVPSVTEPAPETEPAQNMITFTLYNNVESMPFEFHCPEGMTFMDLANSEYNKSVCGNATFSVVWEEVNEFYIPQLTYKLDSGFMTRDGNGGFSAETIIQAGEEYVFE